MTTAGQLITRVLYPLRDASQSFFADGEIIDYMNAAVIDLCAREKLIRAVASGATVGGSIAMTDDMLQIRWVKDPDEDEVAWLDESTFFEYQQVYPDWDAAQPLATIYSNAIWLHPAPDDGESWSIGYYGTPTAMTDDSDDFGLRAQWEEKVVRWARAQCWNRLGETAMGDRDMAYFEEGLRPSQGSTDHQVPGRLSFSREPNVFDVQPDAIHQGG